MKKAKLETYLEDGNCSISNNVAENSIRPFSIGRKNWMFAGSPKGADASACVYSLVETSKANGLDPYFDICIGSLMINEPMAVWRDFSGFPFFKLSNS